MRLLKVLATSIVPVILFAGYALLVAVVFGELGQW